MLVNYVIFLPKNLGRGRVQGASIQLQQAVLLTPGMSINLDEEREINLPVEEVVYNLYDQTAEIFLSISPYLTSDGKLQPESERLFLEDMKFLIEKKGWTFLINDYGKESPPPRPFLVQ